MARRRRGRPRKRKELTIKSEETRTFFGLLILVAAILCVVSLFLEGSLFRTILSIVGVASIPTGITLLLIALTILGYQTKINGLRTTFGFFLLSLIIAAATHLIIPVEKAHESALAGQGGGLVGYTFSQVLIDTFGRFASILVLFLFSAIAVTLISNMTLDQVKAAVTEFLERRRQRKFEKQGQLEPLPQNEEALFIGQQGPMPDQEKRKPLSSDDDIPVSSPARTDDGSSYSSGVSGSVEPESEEPPEIKFPDWQTPPMDILSTSHTATVDPRIYRSKADIIERTLKSFGIQAKVSKIAVGPRVVQYALSITVGTKVAKVKSLGNDLALALAAPSGSVRIEAPIPGTSLIGIEVPNQKPTFVTLGDMLRSSEMKQFSGKLPLVLGKNIAGEPLVRDLAKMPHLLIAGATGSGKSVCVHSFLSGLLMNHSPDYVRLILVDPKMVELPPYNDIPHLLTPVITDMDKVIYTLEWLVSEMQRRFHILKKAEVRNLEQYNAKFGFPALPYIILVVDEMADLMLTSGIDIESKVVRLAQMARAVGIHLVLATQRPSVDVLTGLIKANIPARIGMNVATSVDSRVILDMIGAENLLGDGDMLFKAPDLSRPLRIQGAFVSNKEVEQITGFIKSQAQAVEYNPSITQPQAGNSVNGGRGNIFDDPLFADAVRIVVNSQKASSSLLQRKLSIGYNRAARMVDQLYEAKVVGPQDGSKPRKVLISDAEAFLNRGSQDNQTA
ncbi:MAG: DNA translocase FtsK 4TM domain-containing protein [Candidatus Dojkabacteria bacterium]|nr:DNA translocase FtsK 4TM domain-containing protein [Candidatus Dojkabacteria bacterium]